MNPQALLIIRLLSKTYRRDHRPVDALRDISLELRRGEFVWLRGASGSGKTTLLNLIAALDRPDAGEILFSGTDVTRLSARQASKYRAEKIGFVFQAYNLIPQLTALENVLLPMIPIKCVDQARARQLLDSVGLAERRDHRPSELSGGEQQRVAIARALANDPDLVLADEPTGNLDDESAQNIVALLSGLIRERGKTLLLVAHDRDSGSNADRFFELRGGALVPKSLWMAPPEA